MAPLKFVASQPLAHTVSLWPVTVGSGMIPPPEIGVTGVGGAGVGVGVAAGVIGFVGFVGLLVFVGVVGIDGSPPIVGGFGIPGVVGEVGVVGVVDERIVEPLPPTVESVLNPPTQP